MCGGGVSSGAQNLVVEPFAKRRVADEDGLRAFRAGRNEADANADLVREEINVIAGGGGQSVHLGNAFGGSLPPRKGFLCRLDAAQIL